MKLNNKNLGAVIVCYNTPAGFELRLSRILQLSDNIVLAINLFSDPLEQKVFLETIQELFASYLSSNQIKLLILSENHGIGFALNRAISHLKTCEWLIFFDDDTLLLENEMMAISNEVENLIKLIGISDFGTLGLNYTHDSTLNFTENISTFVEKYAVITSGSIMRMSTFVETGLFREDLFIDSVDIEYSMRLRRLGKKILKSSKIFTYHPIGKIYHIRLMGKTIYLSDHSQLRCYYMTRNRVLIGIEYFKYAPLLLFYSLLQIAFHAIRILLFETQKLPKLLSISSGLNHGFLGKTGRFREKQI